MRNLKTTTLILLLFTACKTHKSALKSPANRPDDLTTFNQKRNDSIFNKLRNNDDDRVIYDPNRIFKNQGEQENYWAEELFKQKYRKEIFDKYNGDIKIIDDNHFLFGNQSLELYNYKSELKSVLAKGILYPQVFGLGDIQITDFEELKFLSHSDKAKRFKLWVFSKGFTNSILSNNASYGANPTVYFIELTNKKATDKTSLEDFIKDAELTFVRRGWLII